MPPSEASVARPHHELERLILTLDVLLLATVSLHGFLGLRSMLQDYARHASAAAWITRITVFLCVATIAYGLLALTAFL